MSSMAPQNPGSNSGRRPLGAALGKGASAGALGNAQREDRIPGSQAPSGLIPPLPSNRRVEPRAHDLREGLMRWGTRPREGVPCSFALTGEPLVQELMQLAVYSAREGVGDPVSCAQEALRAFSKLTEPPSKVLQSQLAASLLQCARLEIKSLRFVSAERLASICSAFASSHPNELRGEGLQAAAMRLTLALNGNVTLKEQLSGLAGELAAAESVLDALPFPIQAEVRIAQAEYLFRTREPQVLAPSRDLAGFTLVREQLRHLRSVGHSKISRELCAHLSVQLGTALIALGEVKSGIEQLRLAQQMARWSGAFGPLLGGTLSVRLGEALSLRHDAARADLEEAFDLFDDASRTLSLPELPSKGPQILSQLKSIRALRESARWKELPSRISAFLESHGTSISEFPLDHAEILLEASSAFAAEGNVERARSSSWKAISLLSEVVVSETQRQESEREGPRLALPAQSDVRSLLYPWSERLSSRITNLISRAIDFSIDNAQPGMVRELAQRAFPLFANDADEGARVRIILDHALVEASLAIRSVGTNPPSSNFAPLSPHRLCSLAEVVQWSDADIGLLPELEQPAMRIRNLRCRALLELAQGQDEGFSSLAKNLLSVGQRYVINGGAGAGLGLEFARAALDAARGLSRHWNLFDEVSSDVAKQQNGELSEEVWRLYSAAERGFSLGLGESSYPAYLALQGLCACRAQDAARNASDQVPQNSGRHRDLLSDPLIRLEKLEPLFYFYDLEIAP
jgi:hypothetical protein